MAALVLKSWTQALCHVGCVGCIKETFWSRRNDCTPRLMETLQRRRYDSGVCGHICQVKTIIDEQRTELGYGTHQVFINTDLNGRTSGTYVNSVSFYQLCSCDEDIATSILMFDEC